MVTAYDTPRSTENDNWLTSSNLPSTKEYFFAPPLPSSLLSSPRLLFSVVGTQDRNEMPCARGVEENRYFGCTSYMALHRHRISFFMLFYSMGMQQALPIPLPLNTNRIKLRNNIWTCGAKIKEKKTTCVVQRKSLKLLSFEIGYHVFAKPRHQA